MISAQMEEYMEAIGRLTERGEPVTTSALARECRVAPPTVTEMLRRLADHGLVSYEPRREPALTQAGRDVASSMIRRHRLWERFLHDVLGLEWDKIHEQACQLEHATSPDLERRLALALGESDTCPHGHAIPGEAADGPGAPLLPLSALAPAQMARVVRIMDEEGAVLRRLGACGIRPGARVELTEASGEGDLSLSVEGRPARLPRNLADKAQARVLLAGEVEAGSDGAIPLGALEAGEAGVIHSFRAGRGLMGRCLALGFTPGVEVTMVQNQHQGPVIVVVRDTRVALGRGEANKIWVIRNGNPHDREH